MRYFDFVDTLVTGSFTIFF